MCQQKHTVHQVQEELNMDDETVYCIETVGAVEHKVGGGGKNFFVLLCYSDDSGETKVSCQLDTGATCNVISFNKLCEIKQT